LYIDILGDGNPEEVLGRDMRTLFLNESNSDEDVPIQDEEDNDSSSEDGK